MSGSSGFVSAADSDVIFGGGSSSDPFGGAGTVYASADNSDPFAGAGTSYGGGSLSGSINGVAPIAQGLGSWAQARLPASWMGVPFRVRESEIKTGRRTAVHEYPFKDTVWVEDLGKLSRAISFRGFLVGDDVDQQLRTMLAAAETEAPGTLVHPALGSMANASLVDCTLSDTDDAGRVYTLSMTFIIGAARVYPSTSVDTQGVVSSSGSTAAGAVSSSYGSVTPFLSSTPLAAGGGIPNVGQVVAGLTRTVGGFVATTGMLAGDVASLGSVRGLQGNYGRFSLGSRLTYQAGITDVAGAVASANAAAAQVAVLGVAARNLAAAL